MWWFSEAFETVILLMATIIQKPNVFLKLQMEQFYNSILHTTFISLYWILLEANSNVVYTPHLWQAGCVWWWSEWWQSLVHLYCGCWHISTGGRSPSPVSTTHQSCCYNIMEWMLLGQWAVRVNWWWCKRLRSTYSNTPCVCVYMIFFN